MQFEPLRIYHEHQSSQLCARHCLNNLLQGPYFTEFDLSQIALDLDKEEQALLAQDGDANNGLIEWLKANKQSQNVSDDGNFSIQVLRRALDNLGLKIYHFGNEETKDAQQHPENETGFICNLQAHWFAIRRIAGQWYDLNSLSGLPETKAKPTTVSKFYLSAYLSTLANDGYSIFVVRSDNWPHLHSYDPQQLLPSYCKWYSVSDVKTRAETYPKDLLAQVNKSRNGQHVTGLGAWGGNNNIGGVNSNNHGGFGTGNMTQDEMLQYAMMQSINDVGGGGGGGNNGGFGMGGLQNQDPELAEALAASMKSYNDGADVGNVGNVDKMEQDEDEDLLLQQALAMSMQQSDGNVDDGDKEKEKVEEMKIEIVAEPDENCKDVCVIQLRLPQNKRIERRFKKEHTLNDVSNYVKSEDSTFSDIVFVCPPMSSYNDMTMTLESICKELNSNKLSFIVKENANKQK